MQSHYHLKAAHNTPISRVRSLLKDICGCFYQQMAFWGCDARHQNGNLLTHYGMYRLPRQRAQTEGSSRYRMEWRRGTIELHSFCVGWYSPTEEGVLYIRNKERLYSCSGGIPATPGKYEDDRHWATTSDAMLITCRPLLEWLTEYELWIEGNTAPDYRHRCWMQLLSRMGARPWLPPEKAQRWIQRFLSDPASTPRAKELFRGRSLTPRVAKSQLNLRSNAHPPYPLAGNRPIA